MALQKRPRLAAQGARRPARKPRLAKAIPQGARRPIRKLQGRFIPKAAARRRERNLLAKRPQLAKALAKRRK
jgi:hypothetical protein